jgi:hypothetical protein
VFDDNKILNFSVLSQYLTIFFYKNNCTQRVGIVIDENQKPVTNATVYRIEKEYFIDEKIGSNESRDLRTENVETDKNGEFKFNEKSRIDWFHTPLDLPIGYCFAEFEIEKNGYKPYKTKFGEFEQYKKENCYACEKIEFNPKIILTKIE